MNGLVTFIGGGAALLSTISFMPQAIKIVRTRDTESISAGMYAVTVAGFILWTTYGVLLRQWPIVGSNGICLIVSAFILTMKLLPRPALETVADALDPGAQCTSQSSKQKSREMTAGT